MKLILQTTRRISFLAFVLGMCLFSVQTAFSQKTYTGNGDWATAANWSGGTLPISTDLVSIVAGQTVTISSGTIDCKKLTIAGSGSSSATQGKVIVSSSATLRITADATITFGTLTLNGGIMENNGILIVKGGQAIDAIRFGNPASGSIAGTYYGTGNLTCDNSAAIGTGSSGNNGAGVVFAQSLGGSGPATFTTNNGSTYTFTLFDASKSAFHNQRGNALIDGNGTISISGVARSIRVIPTAASERPSLTIESGVTLSLSSTITNTALGIIMIDASTQTGATVNMTNKGTINFTGSNLNPISMNNATTAPAATNFTNQGTININGDLSHSSAEGGIYMVGGANLLGNVFTNSGTITFNSVSATTKPLFFCSTTPTNLITNSGPITVGKNGTPPIAFRLGDAETTFNNTGNITIGRGNIEGNTLGTGNAKFNNNGGTLNFDLAAATDVAATGHLAFTNAGGTIKGVGTFTNNNGTFIGTNTFTSGTIAPGQSPGKIAFTDAALTLAGTFTAEVDGTAGAGVTSGHDQIEASTAAAAVTVSGLTIATTISYTPANSDAIVLIKTTGGSITGTPTFSPALPAGWAVTTTGGEVKITYTAPLAAELMTFKATPLSKMNLLTWETASETNNKGFDIQRKTTTGAWETLGFVQGTGKAATYTFEDKGPLSISYYRLRQVDFDGTETLSKVVSVSQNTKGRISITPNPTSDKVSINLNQNDALNEAATVVLFDMTGKQVLTQQTTASAFQLDLSPLAKGMYVLKVQSNNAVYTEKIIRQ